MLFICSDYVLLNDVVISELEKLKESSSSFYINLQQKNQSSKAICGM
jgi:hypothetical protein